MKDSMHADNRMQRCGSELDSLESFLVFLGDQIQNWMIIV